MTELYTDRIFELAANMPRAGRLAYPTASATRSAKLCGSRITVDIVVQDGRITDYAQEVEACLLGQTAAAIVGAHVVGQTPDAMAKLGETMRAMLKAGGAAPEGEWAELGVLLAARDYPARHGSTLLIFEALSNALSDAEQKG